MSHRIPIRTIKSGFTYASLSSAFREIPSSANVTVDDDQIRLYLGDLSLTMPPATWKPIVEALTAALAIATNAALRSEIDA